MTSTKYSGFYGAKVIPFLVIISSDYYPSEKVFLTDCPPDIFKDVRTNHMIKWTKMTPTMMTKGQAVIITSFIK